MIILGILHAFKISYELGNIKQCYLPWANVRILFSTLSLKTPSGMIGKPYLTPTLEYKKVPFGSGANWP
jgi:hypothetical protein